MNLLIKINLYNLKKFFLNFFLFHKKILNFKFRVGDILLITYTDFEFLRENELTQIGLCIYKKSRGLHSTFLLKHVLNVFGYEQLFKLYNYNLNSISKVDSIFYKKYYRSNFLKILRNSTQMNKVKFYFFSINFNLKLYQNKFLEMIFFFKIKFMLKNLFFLWL
jgi:ribosomal protein L19